MQRLIAILLSRWVSSAVGFVLLAALVWVFGPLLPQLEEPVARALVIVCMLVVWGGANVLLDARNRRRDLILTAGVTSKLQLDVMAAEEEATALRERLQLALQTLKRSVRARFHLYEQPWYVIIGPPGAGKTTALLNAGLKFPLAEAMGQGAVAGIGGTRLCDWWFTEDAVLIDTAGRYTTQDSNELVDRAGWLTFLDLLKRARPREPLNGIIVAFPLSDIAAASATERRAHAKAIRQRIEELRQRLKPRLPIYLLFTKADLIAGFGEFFDDLDRQGRAQVWGMTFALAQYGVDPSASFRAEFRLLVERLNQRLMHRLHAERDAARRGLIAMFPGQVASLEEPLAEFVEAVFSAAGSEQAPFLRGGYLTSGTQEGTPIDRLTRSLAATFGLDQAKVPSLRPERGRSYFLERLLRDVIFNEAMLVSQGPASQRRRTVLRVAGITAIIAVLLCIGGAIWWTRMQAERAMEATVVALDHYEQTAQANTLDPVADDDLPRLAPLLDQARDLPYGATTARAVPAWQDLYLSQDAKLAAASRTVYRHALDFALLPRLVWRLEAQIRGNLNRPDFLYEATRVYLMLGSAGPLDPALVHEWLRLDWQAAYPGVVLAQLRDDLLRHVDMMLREPLPPITLDGALVAQARAGFATVPLADRVYARIRSSAAAQRLAPWRPADALGTAGAALFTRASGKPLGDGITGFLTTEGFHSVLLPALAAATKEVTAETWVLGKPVDPNAGGEPFDTVARGVVGAYEAEYAQAWDAMLADLNIAPERSLSQAAQDLYILAAPQSPMRGLLVSIARQLRLSVPLDAPTPTAANAGTSRLESVLRTSAPAEAATPLPGHEIDERYRALLDVIGSGPGGTLDQAMRALSDVQQQLAKMAASLSGSGALTTPAGIDPTLALRAEADRQPQPLGRWLRSVADFAAALRTSNPRQQLAAFYNSSGGPAELCARVVSDRYPFSPGAAQDASLADFARLFAPGGMLDGFVNTLLRPYVDMSGKVWRVNAGDPAAAAVSANDLAQFQRAALIRDTFFADGASRALLRLDVTPISADSGTRLVTLDVAGSELTYSGSPVRATQVIWPGFVQSQSARLTFDPPPNGRSGVLEETGPWAMFRLLARGRVQQGAAPDSSSVTFQLGERQAVFQFRVAGAGNPLLPGLVQEFRCPSVQ